MVEMIFRKEMLFSINENHTIKQLKQSLYAEVTISKYQYVIHTCQTTHMRVPQKSS